jgi:hypothetical protein
MKNILYYLLLLVLIALTGGYMFSFGSSSMSMPQMLGISTVLVIYTVAMCFVGEGQNLDERGVLHRNLSNRFGLIAGNIIFSLGLIYQIFISHALDFWLLAGLIVINLTKLVSLIYLENKK